MWCCFLVAKILAFCKQVTKILSVSMSSLNWGVNNKFSHALFISVPQQRLRQLDLSKHNQAIPMNDWNLWLICLLIIATNSIDNIFKNAYQLLS